MDQTPVVAGAAGGAGRAGEARRPVGYAAELLLLLLPSAHLLYLPVGGAMATGADLALILLLLVWTGELATAPGTAAGLVRVLRGEEVPGLPGRRLVAGVALLVAFAGWVALSGVWGFHGQYAVAKGIGTAALALGALALATSGLTWERGVDAWLAGTAVALVLTVALALAGPEILRARVVYDEGGILGLPFVRISGPLLHPNMLGDYLVVSGVLLWARWPSLSPKAGLGAGILGAAMVVALFLSASTAVVAAGLAAAWLARWSGAHGDAGEEEGERPSAPGWATAVALCGAGVAGATLAALVVPLELSLGPLSLRTSGIRPEIWAGAVQAVAEAPLLGVGAAPYLAEVADPFRGGAAVLWDAHNAYLSVLGQFGLVGAGLLAAGLVLTVRGGLARVDEPRIRFALLVALGALAVNAVFMASEDLRHAWMLLGMFGVAGRVEE